MTKKSREEVFPVVYAAIADSPKDAPDFICFLARRMVGRKTGEPVFDMLPIRWTGKSRVEVEQAAMSFWRAEKIKDAEVKAKNKRSIAKATAVRLDKLKKKRSA